MMTRRRLRTTDSQLERPEPVDQLRIALAADPGGLHPRASAIQVALDTLLQHIRRVRDSPAPGRETTDLVRQIRALQNPLTALLAQRLTTMNPAMPTGEVLFAAAADAQMIVSTTLQCFAAQPRRE